MVRPVQNDRAAPRRTRRRIRRQNQIGKVNIDEQQALATQYGIRAIPTLLIISKGQVAEQMVGAKSKRDLKASLDRAAA